VFVLPPLPCNQSLCCLEFDAVLSCSAYNLMRDRIKSECGDLARGHMQFIFGSGSTVLRLTPDIEVLDSKDGLLTTPLMDFFTIWFQTIIPDDVLLCNSLVGCSLRALVEKPFSTSALHRFYTKKSGFKRMKGRTVMVPVVDCNHWSLAVLSDHAFLKFDSRPSASVSFHGSAKLHECLGQVWCMAIGQLEGTTMWEKSSDIRTWIHVRCPKQEDGWSCGYYVMCFVTMYLAFQKGDDVMDWTCEVRTFPTVFYRCSRPLGHSTATCSLELTLIFTGV
jgi:hypothetical protein